MKSIIEQLRYHSEERPKQCALIVPRLGKEPQRISYASLAKNVDAFAAVFAEAMGRETIIPIVAGKSADAVAAMLGALASGNAFASLNRKLKLPQLNCIAEQGKFRFGLVDASSLAAIAGRQSGDPIYQIGWRVIGEDAEIAPQAKQLEKLQKLAMCERLILPANAVEEFPVSSRSRDSVGCCLFTSGSTGHPKGVLISATDLDERAAAEVELFELTPGDVLLCVLPFSFDVGLNQLLSAIAAGCTIILSESWLPADISRAMAMFGVTGISAVPAIWNDLLNAGIKLNLPEHCSLRYVTVSGGDLPQERLQQLKNTIGPAGIFKTYGQSETFRSAALRSSEFADKSRSVGKPFATATVRIERPDGTPANPNEAGEIVHSGLGTMLGYLDAGRHERPTAIRTGDIGWLDEDGFLFVQGRRDAMLKVAGNRVYPGEIAEQICSLPGIHEAEIIGEKDANGETQLTAFVVASNGAFHPDEIRRSLVQRLPSYMIPRQIVILSQMPRTTSGKPDRVALQSQLQSQLTLT